MQYVIWFLFLVGLILPVLLKHYVKTAFWSEIAACASILLWSALVSLLSSLWLGTDINTAFVRSVLIIGLLYGGSLRFIEERLSAQMQRAHKGGK